MLRKESMEWIDGKLKEHDAKIVKTLSAWWDEIEKRVEFMIEKESKKQRALLVEEIMRMALQNGFDRGPDGKQ